MGYTFRFEAGIEPVKIPKPSEPLHIEVFKDASMPVELHFYFFDTLQLQLVFVPSGGTHPIAAYAVMLVTQGRTAKQYVLPNLEEVTVYVRDCWMDWIDGGGTKFADALRLGKEMCDDVQIIDTKLNWRKSKAKAKTENEQAYQAAVDFMKEYVK